MMLSCQEATELISRSMDRPLSLRERMSLFVHQLICRGCRTTEEQLIFLRTATAAWRQEHANPSDAPVSPPANKP
jgi:hypothetical protein